MQTQVTKEAAPSRPTSERKPDTERFYADVKKAYKELADKKMYSIEYMIGQVAQKFYRSPKTIENIVFNRV